MNRSAKPIIPSSCPLPPSKGSNFFKCAGQCTEVTAKCLVQFATMVQNMDVNTLQFHFERSDFQKWLRHTIGQEATCNILNRAKRGFSGENLRKELLNTVNSCVVELKKFG